MRLPLFVRTHSFRGVFAEGLNFAEKSVRTPVEFSHFRGEFGQFVPSQ
jgi:hypothetical protein